MPGSERLLTRCPHVRGRGPGLAGFPTILTLRAAATSWGRRDLGPRRAAAEGSVLVATPARRSATGGSVSHDTTTPSTAAAPGPRREPTSRAWRVGTPGLVHGTPITLVTRPSPRPGPGEVLVRVLACGVCRTDLHVVEGDLAVHAPHVVPGHEVVGEVLELGPDVGPAIQVGQRVGVPWLRGTCGMCRFCLRGDENLCTAAVFTGWDADGGYAELAVAPAAFVLALPTGYSDAELAPLLCGGATATAPWSARPCRRAGCSGSAAPAAAPTSRPRSPSPGARRCTWRHLPPPRARAGGRLGAGCDRPAAAAAGLDRPRPPGGRLVPPALAPVHGPPTARASSRTDPVPPPARDHQALASPPGGARRTRAPGDPGVEWGPRS